MNKHQLVWRSTFTRHLLAIVGVAGCLLAVTSAEAQVLHTWTGNVDDRFWSVTGNWNPTLVPRIFDDVRFIGAPAAASGLRSFDGTTVRNISFRNGTFINFQPEGAFTANQLEVGGSGGSRTDFQLSTFNGNTLLNTNFVLIGSDSGGGSDGRIFVDAGTVLRVNEQLIVGFEGSDGTLVVRGGRVETLRTGIGTGGEIVVTGSTSRYHVLPGGPANNVGLNGSFTVQNGGEANMGITSNTGGDIRVLDNGSRWNGDRLSVGGSTVGQLARVEARSGGHINLSNFLTVNSDAEVVSEGAGSRIEALRQMTIRSGGAVEALAGGVISTPIIEMRGSGSRLRVAGGQVAAPRIDMTEGGILQLEGGALTTRLINTSSPSGGTVNWIRGDVIITNPAGLTVGSDGLFGDNTTVPPAGSLTVQGPMTVTAGNTLFASGSITSSGFVNSGFADVRTINGHLTNTATGNLSSNFLTLTGGLLNQGGIELFNGLVRGPVDLRAGSSITLRGTLTFEDDVTGAGDFDGAGLVTFNGGYSPGDSPAVIDINGGITFGSASTFTIELGGLAPGEFDMLNIQGNATLGGMLMVELLGSFLPAPGDVFEILNVGGALTGQFAGLDEGALIGNYGGMDLFITYAAGDGNDVVLYSNAMAVPGDFDGDGDVDGADFVVWQTNFPTASGATLADGDADGDGDVDGADFVVWQTNFPFTPGPGVAPVPEPQALLLALIAAAGFTVCRRRAYRASKT